MTEQLFVGGGEMGALLRSHDWSQTQLGVVETWSDDLKTAVQALLVELDQAKLPEKQPLSDLPPGDMTAIVLREMAQADEFRVKLTDALRPLTDPIEIQAIAAQILGESLSANRVIYTEVVSDGEEVIVHKSYTNGVTQLSGRYHLEDYRRNLTEDHQAGRTQVVTDIPHNPGYTDAEKAKYSAIGIAAHIDVPLIKNNQFVALLAVHQATPRQWTEAEVKQVEETAERTWAAVERARAEAELQKSQEKYRQLFESIDEGYFIADVVFDDQDRPIDIFYLEANPAVKRITGLDLAGCSLREIDPNYESHWWETFGRVAQTGIGERQELYAEPLKSWFNFYAFKVGDADSYRVAAAFQDVTERKNLEQERERFLAVGSDLQVITGSDGYFRWVSPTFERLLGRTPAEMTARPWTDFVHPDNIPDSVAETDSLFSGKETLAFENRYRHKDGSYRWFLWNAQPYPEEGVIYGAAIDITDRKLAETALRDSETKLRLFIEQVPVSVAMFDQQMRYLTVSQRWVDDYHLESMEAVTGRSHYDLFPNLPDRWRQVHQRCLADASDKCDEDWFVLPDGSEQWLHWEINPWYDSTGTVGGIVLFAENITQRKQAEASLRLSEQRLKLAVKTAKLGSWQLDLQTNELFTSEQCKVNYGVSLDADFSHRVLLDRIHPDDRAWVEGAVQQAIEQQTDYDVEYRTVWNDGSLHWALVRGSTVYDDKGTPLHMVGMSLDITDRKQAETLLRASHDSFRYLVENSPFGIYTVDADFRLAQVSAGAQKVFETVRPLIGRDFAEVLRVLWPEPFASEAIAHFRHTLETREPYHAPSTIERRHDIGEVESYDWKLERIVLPDGRFGVVCHFYDLSERQRYEAALRDSEERFRQMADNAPVMIWVTDPTGYCTYLSQRWYNFTGQTEETGLGFGWLSRVHPDDRELSERIFLNANQRQEAFSLEYRLQSKQGDYIWAIDAASPRFGVEGQFQGYIGSVLDITERKRVEDERKQAEAALRESENRLRLALESAELGTWDFNPTTGVLQWDDQCKAMFGLSPEAEINYDRFLAGLHPDDRDRTDQVVQFALNPESGGEYDIEYRTIGIEDGVERWIAAKGKAFFNPAGTATRFIGTVLNMTEKKQAEAERERLLQREQAAREAAETANRIKDEFLAVLSHELRSPLNPILGWSRLLQQGKLDAAKTTTALATIERNAKLQAQLIEDLLDISRILQGKLTLNIFPVDLSFVISAAIETVRLAIDAKAIQLNLALDPEVGQILGDAARLQQVVWNLLSNAVKFTPANGQITIALSSADCHAQIQVTDTGKGIKPEFLPYVFEHFRQEDGATTRKFGGLGLGLAIVQQIVELHGGMVTANSFGEGKGATFTVQIPLASCSSALPAVESSFNSSIDLDGVRILVVDDEADSREFITFVLEQAGAIVTALDSGFDALQAFSQRTPDIILSDIGMPEMDGYMLIQQIRARSEGKQVPAIALTAYAGEIDQKQAIAAGFQRHLAKPIDPGTVVAIVTELVSSDR